MIQASELQTRWQPTLLALVGVLGWLLFWYWGTFSAIVHIWYRSDTYAHGFVVPPIVLWLIWGERKELIRYQPIATPWLLLPMGGVVFAWLLGELTSVNALTQFAAVCAIAIATMSLLGLRLSRRLAFPLAFLFFAIPFGDFMMPQLMEWTSRFTVLALRLTGIPVYQEGLQFIIPSGSWSVVEACSGIRYMIASVTVGTLFAYLNYSSLKRRLIFIGISLLVPLLANWVRAYLIVMLGHFSGNELATGADHLIYGWVFFGIVIMIMFMIGMRWSEHHREHIPSAEQAALDQARYRSPWPIALALAIVAAAGPLAFSQLSKTSPDSSVRLEIPMLADGWNISKPFTNWKPAFANPAGELHTAFANQDKTVGLYIGYYKNQNYDRKLVTSTNLLVDYKDSEWAVTTQGSSMVNIAGIAPRVRTGEILHKGGSTETRFIVWQWYWINGQLTASDIKAKLYTALMRLTGKGDDSAIIILYTPKQQAESAMNDFAMVNAEKIIKMLEQTREKN